MMARLNGTDVLRILDAFGRPFEREELATPKRKSFVSNAHALSLIHI